MSLEAIIKSQLKTNSVQVDMSSIADFGEAYNPRVTKQFAVHMPLLLAPPESRFAEASEGDEPLSFPGDIWTLACTIWDIFGSSPTFEAFPVTLDEVTIEQVEMLGKLPDRWWSKWPERNNWFDEDSHKNVKETNGTAVAPGTGLSGSRDLYSTQGREGSLISFQQRRMRSVVFKSS